MEIAFIVLGAALFFIGAYFYIDTYKRSGLFSIGKGTARIMLSMISVISGSASFAFGVFG